MIFNLFALNQDDHSKNWAFLQDDHGNWKLSPFYDVTFSPSPHGEHATAFGGYGKTPPLKVIQLLARHAGFSSWKEAQHSIQETVEAINQFSHHAKNLEVSASTSKLISKSLNEVYLLNKSLLNA